MRRRRDLKTRSEKVTSKPTTTMTKRPLKSVTIVEAISFSFRILFNVPIFKAHTMTRQSYLPSFVDIGTRSGPTLSRILHSGCDLSLSTTSRIEQEALAIKTTLLPFVQLLYLARPLFSRRHSGGTDRGALCRPQLEQQALIQLSM